MGVLGGNYLRVRGEYPLYTCPKPFTGELPPRARRIPIASREWNDLLGTTSACAENTLSRVADIFGMRNYLRVRGEYESRLSCSVTPSELPPRARRILGGNYDLAKKIGTTSACAENTCRCRGGGLLPRNYLRVRGEYSLVGVAFQMKRELPPRARRIQNPLHRTNGWIGTTSACAENTSGHLLSLPYRRNYLRVRGEYRLRLSILACPRELPPRARRIQATAQ